MPGACTTSPTEPEVPLEGGRPMVARAASETEAKGATHLGIYSQSKVGFKQ